MSNHLQKILDHKKTEVAKIIPRAGHLLAAALRRDDFRGFISAIDRGRAADGSTPLALGLIAEVKKASPSAGTIVETFDPVRIAKAYELAGAHAVSVLTDVKFFQGSLDCMTRVRRAISLPVLRKDFIIHEAQIFEAVCAGADAILLIVAALGQKQLVHLLKTAVSLQLEALVEVHTVGEMARALDCGAKIIGINNRNLATFEVDLAVTEQISGYAPNDVILVSESGIKTAADSRRIFDCGVNSILVGESLMRSGNVSGKVAELLQM